MSGTIAIEIFLCLLVADFASGVFHWLEDSYGDVEWPILGLYITRPNILHHYDPRHFVRNNTWFGRMRTLGILGLALLLAATAVNQLSWQVWVTILLGINANEIHKWSHCSSQENGTLINAMQQVGLIQSPLHHAQHHLGRRDSHYCVMTNYLNPVLDATRFWRNCEAALLHGVGLQKRMDPTLE